MALKALKFIISISIFISSLVFANDFVIKNVKNEAFKQSDFPFFSSKKHPQSATNINELIQYDFFKHVHKESDFSNKTLSPFRGKTGERKAYIFGFDVNKNENYITLSISADGCGAYCEEFTKTYIFDVYTGRVVSLIDLLSPTGAKHLAQTMREANKSKIAPYIKVEPLESKSDDVNERAMREYLEGQYYMYLDCYQNLLNDKDYAKVDADTAFSIGSNSIRITQGRCSNHAERAFDEIGSFNNKFTFKELESYLNSDAKGYLSNKAHKLSDIKTPYQIYHGKIANKYPITILRQQYGGWVYWYDKYKTPIDLHSLEMGQKNAYTLQEGHHDGDHSWIYTSELRLKENNNVFKGVFVNLKNGKKMAVEFQ